MHAGMSYARLEELGGMQWPCYDEDHPGEPFLHSRLWERPAARAARRRSRVVEHEPPVDKLDDEFPLRLTTGRRLDDYNTGVQTAGYALAAAPRARPSTSRPRTPRGSASREGEIVRVRSRRGQVEVPVRIDDGTAARAWRS